MSVPEKIDVVQTKTNYEWGLWSIVQRGDRLLTLCTKEVAITLGEGFFVVRMNGEDAHFFQTGRFEIESSRGMELILTKDFFLTATSQIVPVFSTPREDYTLAFKNWEMRCSKKQELTITSGTEKKIMLKKYSQDVHTISKEGNKNVQRSFFVQNE